MPRLSACLALLALALSLTAQAPKASNDDRDLLELQHYILTMDKVTRFVQTFADLQKYGKAHPAPETSTDKDDAKSSNQDSLADMEKRFAAHPEVVAILTSHGFTVHEFAIAELTILQCGVAVYARKQGTDPARLASDAHVNLANITFMEQHEAEIDALQARYNPKPTDN